MLALHILDLKDFTGKLFIGDVFHRFYLTEASFTTSVTFTIDGMLHKEFYDSDSCPDRTCCYWEEVKTQCFSFIKGKKTPLHFKIIFQLSRENTEKLLARSGLSLKPEDICGLYLNLQFDGTQLICTTGTSLRIFTMDKTLDHVWDDMIRKYFRKQSIVFEEM